MREIRANNNKKTKKLIIIIIAAVVVLAAIVAIIAINASGGAVDPDDKTKVSVVVEEGAGTGAIGEALKEKDLINSVFMFKVKSKLSGNDGQYKPGVYSLSKSQTMSQIMDIIVKGQSDVERFTIPEGYTTKQTMGVLVKAGLVTEEEFMDEIVNGEFDYKFLSDVPEGENRLEGYLYPETYEVYKNASAHDIIDKMLAQFDSLFKDEYYDKAKEMGYSVQDIVNMASVIERESKSAKERPIMAGVFYNRLEKGMKLQSCATVQYILEEPKEHLTNSDIAIDDPYNTYIYEGLPPGPVCSPRIQSIEAALYPDDNDYIFFVLKPELDGTHNFSADSAQFEKDKAAYKKAVGTI